MAIKLENDKVQWKLNLNVRARSLTLGACRGRPGYRVIGWGR